ncbi:MAG TPA: hypothetical protein VGL35_15355 [Rhizomicrobium sp.]|jgi:hypothetical protein
MRQFLLTAAAACLLCPAAMAATSLSGAYAVSYLQTCQVVVDVDKTTGAITFNKQSTGGADASSPGLIIFDPEEGTFDWSGTVNGVSVVLEQFSDGSKKGKQGNSYAFDEPGVYSNDDTTLTIGGVVYDIVYSGIDQTGTAHGFAATLHLPIKHLPANHCVVTLQGQMQ